MKIYHKGERAFAILDELEEQELSLFCISGMVLSGDQTLKDLCYQLFFSKILGGWNLDVDMMTVLMDGFVSFPVFLEEDLICGRYLDRMAVRCIWYDTYITFKRYSDGMYDLPYIDDPQYDDEGSNTSDHDSFKREVRKVRKQFLESGHAVDMADIELFVRDYFK